MLGYFFFSEDLEKTQSRWALSSGRSGFTVSDGQPSEGSPFAKILIRVLRENKEDHLSVAELVDTVKRLSAHNYEQLPQGDPIYGSGHNGGQFLFRLKTQTNELKGDSEIDIWDSVRKLDSKISYLNFLEKYPSSKHARIAEERIRFFEEEEAWRNASVTNNLDAFNEFLISFPSSKYEKQAKIRLEELYYEEKYKFQKEKVAFAQRLIERTEFDRAEKIFIEIYEELPEVLTSYLPKSVFNKGVNGIIKFFDELKLSQNAQVFETRVILVGEGSVGKTSLTRKLINPGVILDLNEKTTHGIKIFDWKFFDAEKREMKARIWDFGGQEIYRSTHQFFFSKRAFYILVWEARRDEKFDYWLQIIDLLADSSPVVIVQNKTDIRIGSGSINEKKLKDNYKNILGYFKVSCLNNNGIGELTKFVKNRISKLPHLEQIIPKSWVRIKEEIENLDRNYVSYSKYVEICNNNGLIKGNGQLLEYLHDLGVVLHFKKHHSLKHTIFLNPNWVTEAVYKVIDDNMVIENRGYFNFNDLEQIWGEKNRGFQPSRYNDLIELMKKFEICFQSKIGDGNNPPEYIIPELLSPSSPDLFNFFNSQNENVVRFKYFYPNILPPGLIPRFICRNNQIVNKKFIWRTGAILNYETSNSLVVAIPEKNEINVTIYGNSNRDLLEIIRYNFFELHETLNLIGVEAKLPCICSYNGCKIYMITVD